MTGDGSPGSEGVRLQKVLAGAGVASRRAAEELIAGGRVAVNGRVATLGQRVDPGRDRITLDGKTIPTRPNLIYLALNKPAGVVTTARDPQRRTTVLDLIDIEERVWPVGRLDADSEGLLLITNDGELTHRITHPSFEVPKVYLAEVEGDLERRAVGLLERGVDIGEERPARADQVRIVDRSKHRRITAVEVVLHEGRKRVVRRMMEAVGHPVRRLVRTALGPVTLGSLAPGDYRSLTIEEVLSIYEVAGL